MYLMILPNITEDDEQLALAQKGDKQAITQLYQRYLEPIYQFVRIRTGDKQIAEDITSEVFLKFVKGLREGKGPKTHVRGWLFKVARNEINRHYGEMRSMPIEVVDDWLNASTEETERQVFFMMDIELIKHAFGKLTPEQQEVLILRFDQRLSLQETADVMGKNINTIKTLQLRATLQLRHFAQLGKVRGRYND